MKWIRSYKRWLYLLLAILVCGGGTFYFLEAQSGAKSADQEEVTAVVKKGNIRSSVTGTSQLVPKQTQVITSPADAVIQKINLTRNMNVKTGDVLVQLSSPELESNMQKAKATLASMKTDLQGVAEQMNSLRATAPIGGKLTLGNGIDVGSTINKNARIATISDNSKLKVTLPFSLQDSLLIHKGDEVELSIDNFMLTKTGTVTRIGTTPKPDLKGGKLVDVEISIENDATMDAGLKAKGTITAGDRVLESADEGPLEYSQTVNVLAGVAGTIEELGVASGDIVKQGQLLVIIANDTIQNDYATKKSNYDQQVLAVSDLQDKLDELTIKAPFDGVFSTDFVDQKTNVLDGLTVGTKVTTATQFGGVADMATMQLPIQVDELDLPNVKLGMKAEVKADSISGRIFNAEVTQVSTVGTTTNGVTYYDVVLAVKNNNGILKNGMTATGEILFQDRSNVLVIPVEALQRRMGQSFVSLKKPDGTVESQHQIQIGIRSDTSVEVTEGLKEGDEVVIPVMNKQQTMSAQDIQKLRQQFQNGQGGAGFQQMSPEELQQIREQFRSSFGGGNRNGGTGSGSGGSRNSGGGGTGGGGSRNP